MDVTGAFLYGELKEDVYMTQPPGYEDGTERVLKLHKSIYGLKQAPRCWNEKLDEALKRKGFQQSKNDPALYTLEQNGDKLWLIDFVDDMLLVPTSPRILKDVKQYLMSQFKMTDEGPAGFYLGMEIRRNLQTKEMWVHQAKYIRDMLTKYGMEEAKIASTPLPPGFRTWFPHEIPRGDGEDWHPPPGSPYPHDPLCTQQEIHLYRQIVGSVGYAAKTTRPDVAFAMGQLAQVQHCPRQRHLSAAHHCLRYLKGTMRFGLYFKGSKGSYLEGFTDSDYAGDHGEAKSHSGIVFRIAGAPVVWQAKKQSSVSKSSTEAEFTALSAGASECVWLRNLMQELGVPQNVPTPIFVDNESTVKLSKNPVFFSTTKHIRVNFNYVQELQKGGTIDVIPIKTTEQTADFLTKPLQPGPFKACRELVGMCEAPD
jgi:hypothetical protein